MRKAKLAMIYQNALGDRLAWTGVTGMVASWHDEAFNVGCCGANLRPLVSPSKADEQRTTSNRTSSRPSSIICTQYLQGPGRIQMTEGLIHGSEEGDEERHEPHHVRGQQGFATDAALSPMAK